MTFQIFCVFYVGTFGENVSTLTFQIFFILQKKMYVGTLNEQVSSRRTWRLGGGFIKYQSTSTVQYDGDTRVRRVSTGVFF
jgi:hypothetical protein